MSTVFPAPADSTFRLSVSTFQIRPVCELLWQGDLTTYFLPFSWYCTQIVSKGTPLLPPGSAFRRTTRLQYHHFGVVRATVSVLSFFASSRLFW